MPAPIATSTIVAQAFRFMEMAPISSFGDDSEQAQSAADQYPVALDECLEACDWAFASRYVELSALTALPAGEVQDPVLPYVYVVPGDCIKIREMADKTVRWRRDGTLIRADQAAPLALRYTFRVQNESLLPSLFRTAVAARLAFLLAGRWVGNTQLQARLEGLAEARLKSAMKATSDDASLHRYDGRPDQPDWASEARA